MTTADAGIFNAPRLEKRLNVEALATRVYTNGFVASDFANGVVKPGVVIVSPVRPPKVVAGIHVPDNASEVPGQLCMIHRVEAVGELEPGCLPLHVGDVVACMLAFLDPLDPKGNLLDILASKVVAVLGNSG